MMIRLLHLLSLLAVIAAGGIFTFCAVQWRYRDDAFSVDTTRSPQSRGAAQTAGDERLSPLITAAQGLAANLLPPPPVREKTAVQDAPKPGAPVVRPPTATPQFKVRGTICAGPSEKSIALIWEPGVSNAGRWVKEGTQLGHFVIHEIRPGSVVYLDGDKLCEMAIERETTPAATTVVATAAGVPTTNLPEKSAGNTRPAQTTNRSKRPTGGNGFTVGSPRTSTLN
ncbi:MAG: hypothetical protein ACM3VT_05235 [Solirubrobacterales bacterium]